MPGWRKGYIGRGNGLQVHFQGAEMLADFGKRLALGLVIAACVVGVHAAMVFSSMG